MSAKPSTKAKIKAAALKLFNEQGMVNVRLQQIADEAAISVGNLAYHYPSKEHIAMALYDELAQAQQGLLKEYREVPLFEYLDRFIERTFELQQHYVFFYLDTLEIVRAYPVIGEAHQQQIEFQLMQLSSMLRFNLARGAFVKEAWEGLYAALALQLWQSMDFWRVQQQVRQGQPPNPEDYKNAIWALLRPYFTPLGKQEYLQMLERPYDFFYNFTGESTE